MEQKPKLDALDDDIGLNDEITESLEELCNKNTIFPINSEQEGLYIQLTKESLKYYSCAFYFDWESKDDSKHWKNVKIKKAPMSCPTPYLIGHVKLNTQFRFEHVISGKYKFSLMHLPMAGFNPDRLIVKVRMGDKVLYTNEHFPSEESLDKCRELVGDDEEPDLKKIEMYNEQMCEFEIKDEDVPDKKQGVTINVEFSQRELEAGEDKFLSDWYIHGGTLERELFELSSDNKASDAEKEQQKKELLDKIASIKKKRKNFKDKNAALKK